MAPGGPPGWSPTAGVGLNAFPAAEIQLSGALRGSTFGDRFRGVPGGREVPEHKRTTTTQALRGETSPDVLLVLVQS